MVGGHSGAVQAETEDRWTTALAAVLADPAEPRVVFQPVVDLVRGTVAGYEALSRFRGPPQQPPDAWFSAAERLGLEPELQARALATALAARSRLPANAFLALNVDPNLLVSGPVELVLREASPLGGVVLELTEHTVVEDYPALAEAVGRVRAAGAMIAVDDAGAGYASLSHIVALRPDFVKLDRSMVSDVDRDSVKRALVELLGAFAGQVDAWLIAEGVERESEMEALASLGVPLGQGYLLGRPGPEWVPVDAAVASRIVRHARAGAESSVVAGLAEAAPAVVDGDKLRATRAFDADPSLDLVALLDRWERPVGWVDRAGTRRPCAQVVKASSPVRDVARRAMTRPADQRFDPLPVSDDLGRFTGLVRLERLVEDLSGGGTE